MMQLAQVAEAVHGRLVGNAVLVSGVTIDSRLDCTGRLFLALKGQRFDAHDHIAQAQSHGALAAVVEKTVKTDLPYVVVADSHQALMDLAGWWRAQFVLPVIGITGSVGKTSVKDMVGSVFAEIGKGLVTQGNFNNEIGLPLTLLRLTADDTYAVLEMGMNQAGEIARLSQLSRPTIALINNAAAAHLEGLGTVAAVAAAKGEILSGLSVDGVAVINADDQYAPMWRKLAASRKIVSFGLDTPADVSAAYQLSTNGLQMRVTAAGASFDIELPLIGKHNVMNALAAIAIAIAANIPQTAIIAGLMNFRPIAGRFNVSKPGNITLIDDTYNANPASVQAAIEALAQYPESTLILGDMAELGAASIQEHLHLGELANVHGIGRLYAVGEYSEQTVRNFTGSSKSFAKQTELLEFLSEHVIDTGTILVKGSRSARMEKVVEHLEKVHTAKAAESIAGGSSGGTV